MSLECLLEKYGLHLTQNGFEWFITSKLSKNCFLQFFYFFNSTTEFVVSCILLNHVLTFMILFTLFSNLERLIIGFLKVLLVWGFMHIMASKISIYYTRDFFVKILRVKSSELYMMHPQWKTSEIYQWMEHPSSYTKLYSNIVMRWL